MTATDPCGCCVKWNGGEPLIQRCALHEAAPEMERLLRLVAAKHREGGVWLDGITYEAVALLASLEVQP